LTRALAGNDVARKFFKPGEILGALGTLLGSASTIYVVGRVKDHPKVQALTWQPITFSFTATGTTATLSFTSLTPFANSYGALIDNVRVLGAPAAYPPNGAYQWFISLRQFMTRLRVRR
jgi:hypothetical protein